MVNKKQNDIVKKQNMKVKKNSKQTMKNWEVLTFKRHIKPLKG